MSGKLITCSVADMNKYSHIQNKYLITIVCNNNPTELKRKYGFEWCPSLAPTSEIFQEYRRLVNKNQWGLYMFNNWYTPAFINHILNNKASTDMLNYIYSLLKADHDVVIACYCGNVNLCHRSLVALQFQNLGFDVEYY